MSIDRHHAQQTLYQVLASVNDMSNARQDVPSYLLPSSDYGHSKLYNDSGGRGDDSFNLRCWQLEGP
jgi:hypothetical protein